MVHAHRHFADVNTLIITACRHEFVVVETIDFYDDEDDELPPPLTLKDIVMATKAGVAITGGFGSRAKLGCGSWSRRIAGVANYRGSWEQAWQLGCGSWSRGKAGVAITEGVGSRGVSDGCGIWSTGKAGRI
jgi:hypothetical protein